jgi:DNA-binding CsgD family transcriptional regulator
VIKRGRPVYPGRFTPKEEKVLNATKHGLSNAQIAKRLGVSINAVKFHLRNIKDKTHLRSKQALRLDSKNASYKHAGDFTMNSSILIGQIARSISSIKAYKQWLEDIAAIQPSIETDDMLFYQFGDTRLMLSATGELNPNESIFYLKIDDIHFFYQDMEKRQIQLLSAPHKIYTHADGTEEWMAFIEDPDGRPVGLMSQQRP